MSIQLDLKFSGNSQYDHLAESGISLQETYKKFGLPENYQLLETDVYKILASIFLKIKKRDKNGNIIRASSEINLNYENGSLSAEKTKLEFSLSDIRKASNPKKGGKNSNRLLLNEKVDIKSELNNNIIIELLSNHPKYTLNFFSDFCNRPYYFKEVGRSSNTINKKKIFYDPSGETGNQDILLYSAQNWCEELGFSDFSNIVNNLEISDLNMRLIQTLDEVITLRTSNFFSETSL